MTPEELLAELRDIHLPPEPNSGVWNEFALWPLLLLGSVVALIVARYLWQRNQWRRTARAELANILQTGTGAGSDGARIAEQWPELLAFAVRLCNRDGSRNVTLPEVAFHHPDTLSEADRAEFVAFLQAELRR